MKILFIPGMEIKIRPVNLFCYLNPMSHHLEIVISLQEGAITFEPKIDIVNFFFLFSQGEKNHPWSIQICTL